MKTLLLLGTVLLVAPAQAAIQVTYERQALNVSGITRGGAIAVFGVNLGVDHGYPRVHKEEQIVRDDAGTSTVRVAVTDAISFRSLWVIVDVETGDYVVSTPPGFRPRLMAPPLIAVADQVVRIQKPSVEAFLVRPKLGAWGLSVADGRDGDDDGPATHGLTIAAEHLHAIGGTPRGPARFLPGDILVLCDTDWMEYAVVRVQVPGGH